MASTDTKSTTKKDDSKEVTGAGGKGLTTTDKVKQVTKTGITEPVVDQYTQRSDDDVLFGHFCTIVKGDHDGRQGVYEGTSSLDSNGYPDEVRVRIRDATNEVVAVSYADIRPLERGARVR